MTNKMYLSFYDEMVPVSPNNLRSRFAPIPLNEVELKAVRSMIGFAAMMEGSNEEKICEFLLTAFGVTSLQGISSARYDEVLQFLLAPMLENETEN